MIKKKASQIGRLKFVPKGTPIPKGAKQGTLKFVRNSSERLRTIGRGAFAGLAEKPTMAKKPTKGKLVKKARKVMKKVRGKK